MNLAEIKAAIMHQTNNDADDLGDFLPFLVDYINEGYDRLVHAFAEQHVSADSDEYTPLKNDKSAPNLPDWLHRYVADWATWLVYRNGNAQKQNRGYAYRNAFLEVEARLRGMTLAEKGFDESSAVAKAANNKKRYFFNLPR